jgi:hypothetical protein
MGHARATCHASSAWSRSCACLTRQPAERPGNHLVPVPGRVLVDQGRASGRRRPEADVTEVARAAREPGERRGSIDRHGQRRERAPVVGEAGHRGRLGLRRASGAGAPRRGGPPPGLRPRTGPHGTRRHELHELADARTASGHEHQGDEASRPNRERSGPGGRVASDLPAVGLWAAPGTCQVKSDLTEPVRRPVLAGNRVGGRSGRVPTASTGG